jgi:hypothetical protein
MHPFSYLVGKPVVVPSVFCVERGRQCSSSARKNGQDMPEILAKEEAH